MARRRKLVWIGNHRWKCMETMHQEAGIAAPLKKQRADMTRKQMIRTVLKGCRTSIWTMS